MNTDVASKSFTKENISVKQQGLMYKKAFEGDKLHENYLPDWSNGQLTALTEVSLGPIW